MPTSTRTLLKLLSYYLPSSAHYSEDPSVHLYDFHIVTVIYKPKCSVTGIPLHTHRQMMRSKSSNNLFDSLAYKIQKVFVCNGMLVAKHFCLNCNGMILTNRSRNFNYFIIIPSEDTSRKAKQKPRASRYVIMS